MDLTQLPMFEVLKTKLGYHSERQALLAQNIANADTPNYHAKDVGVPDFKKILESSGGAHGQKLQMAATDGQHMRPGSAIGMGKVEDRKTTNELNPNGNNVVIEEEMMNVAQNQAEYQKSLLIYRKMIAMFNIALGKPANG